VAALGGLILALACLASAGSRFGSQSIFVYLGEISYSTYMICIPWKIISVNAATKILHIEGDQIAPDRLAGHCRSAGPALGPVVSSDRKAGPKSHEVLGQGLGSATTRRGGA
jgi:hypothetical protein